MPTLVKCLLIAIMLAPGVHAQSYGQTEFEQALAAIEAKAAAHEKAKLERKEWARRRFIDPANEFVHAWNKFAEHLASGEYDYRLAKQVSTAFHKMEQSGYSPNSGLPEKHNSRKPASLTGRTDGQPTLP